MDHLRRLGNRIAIRIQPDKDGFTGRECPNPECEGYFKITFGTGLTGEDLPCHCPYCGHSGPPDHFWTQEQIEYAKSVAKRQVVDAVRKDLKKLEFEHRPRGAFDIGFSMKLERGRPIPIRYYREEALQTEVICDNCTLRYAIYGVFAFCPDCRRHNSYQMLGKNLEVVTKKLAWAESLDADIAKSLREDALANVVSAFDGFGREVCRVHAQHATTPKQAQNMSFQNLEGARKRVKELFGFDLADGLDADGWCFANRCFQKRHLFAHKMGVVDEDYVAKAGDAHATLGHRINVPSDEITKLVKLVAELGRFLVAQLGSQDQSNDEKCTRG